MWRGILLYYRRLPPFLRVATVVGLVCVLTSVVLNGWVLAGGIASDAAGFSATWRIVIIGTSLLAVGLACTVLSNAYRLHMRSPDTRGFPFHSWQQQARITALVATLPISAFVLALVVPLGPGAVIAAMVNLVGMFVVALALAWAASWPADTPPDSPASPDP